MLRQDAAGFSMIALPGSDYLVNTLFSLVENVIGGLLYCSSLPFLYSDRDLRWILLKKKAPHAQGYDVSRGYYNFNNWSFERWWQRKQNLDGFCAWQGHVITAWMNSVSQCNERIQRQYRTQWSWDRMFYYVNTASGRPMLSWWVPFWWQSAEDHEDECGY